MIFVDVTNAFGTDAFAAPTSATVKPHKLPRVKKSTRVRRAPKPPTTILRNFLLTYNG